MRYPVVVHNVEFAGFGAIAPDFTLCHCHASTLDLALQKMAELLAQRLQEIQAIGAQPPVPGELAELRKTPAFTGGLWAIIDVDIIPDI